MEYVKYLSIKDDPIGCRWCLLESDGIHYETETMDCFFFFTAGALAHMS